MKKLIILAFCLLLAIPSMGQRTLRLLQEGDAYYKNEEYTKAIESYDKILRRDRSPEIRKEVSFRMGESYRNLLNYEQAWKWYTVAMNVGYQDPAVYLHLGEMSLGLEAFDNAIHYAEKFLEQRPEDPFGEKILESALFSKENYFKESLIKVTNEMGVNSEGQEWGIGFFENYDRVQNKMPGQNNGQLTEPLKERIVFASTKGGSSRVDSRTGTGYSNIYQATYSRGNNQWDPPTLLQGEINSEFYEGFLSFDKENLRAYYMNCGGYRGTRSTCDIYTSSYDPAGNQWGIPSIFPFNSDEFNIGYPSINEKGNVLYFASDMPGGFGGYDLYKIRKDSITQQWDAPVNLGPVINTELNDAYPYIAGDILYFSSFGHPGFGGFDIFYSVIDDQGIYSQPDNMGAPINSSADDFSFIINNEYTRGYFTSNRPGGAGDDDIYSFVVTPERFALKGTVADSRTGKAIPDAALILTGKDNQEQVISTDSQGNYTAGELSSGDNYKIDIIHSDYYPFHESFSVKDKLIASRFLVITEFLKDIQLDPISPEEYEPNTFDVLNQQAGENQTFAIRPDIRGNQEGLPTIYFDFGQWVLTRKGKAQADSVVAFLKEFSDVGLVVNAHTDEVSGFLFNFHLSQQRAQSIIDYITRQGGIDPNRLFPFGHGKMELVIPGAQTSEQHQLNRRGDFEVLQIDDFSKFLEQAPRYSFRYLNSLHKEAHHSSGIEFMIQIAASKKPLHPRFYSKIMEAMPNLDVIYYYDKDRYHRYSVGSFKDLKTSVNIHNQLRKLGFQTYIVAFNDGERIGVAEANRILLRK